MCNTDIKFSRHFSEIEGLQKPSIVSYYAEPLPSGVALSVKEESENSTKAEFCICPDLTGAFATKLLQLAYENNFGLGCWFNLLDDLGIRYSVVPSI